MSLQCKITDLFHQTNLQAILNWLGGLDILLIISLANTVLVIISSHVPVVPFKSFPLISAVSVYALKFSPAQKKKGFSPTRKWLGVHILIILGKIKSTTKTLISSSNIVLGGLPQVWHNSKPQWGLTYLFNFPHSTWMLWWRPQDISNGY